LAALYLPRLESRPLSTRSAELIAALPQERQDASVEDRQK